MKSGSGTKTCEGGGRGVKPTTGSTSATRVGSAGNGSKQPKAKK
jgi:hypothetical protein